MTRKPPPSRIAREVPGSSSDIRSEVGAALSQPQWQFRTVDGIAREIDRPAQQVKRALDSSPALARKSALTDGAGNDLYALRRRPVSLRERIERVRWLLAR